MLPVQIQMFQSRHKAPTTMSKVKHLNKFFWEGLPSYKPFMRSAWFVPSNFASKASNITRQSSCISCCCHAVKNE